MISKTARGTDPALRRARSHRGLTAALTFAFCAAAVGGCGGASHSSRAPVRTSAKAAGTVAATGSHRALDHPVRATPGGVTRLHNGPPKPRAEHGAGVAGEASCADSTLMPSAGEERQLGVAIVCLLNAERSAAGLPLLATNVSLAGVAGNFAGQMIAQKFFAHTAPDGTDLVARVRPTGYLAGDWVVGENLGWGSGDLSTPAAIMDAWMNSPEHRANVLAPDYREVGLGVAMGSPIAQYSGGAIYVADFGMHSGTASVAARRSAGTGSRTTVGAAAASVVSVPRAIVSRSSRTVLIPVRCSRGCAVTSRVYYHHRRIGSGKRRLRHAGAARVRVHLTRHLHHRRLEAVTRVRGKHRPLRSVVRLR